MEEIEKIKAFLADVGSGSGYGYGYGYGYGDGDGSGYGSGSGSGYGSGYGDGSGDGYQIRKLTNDSVFYVDGVPTIFEKIKGSVAHVRWDSPTRTTKKRQAFVRRHSCISKRGIAL